MNNYEQLKILFKRLAHLQYLERILMWDESVMMPEGAHEARANALATFNRMMQKMLINKKNKALINSAKAEDGLSSWDVSNLEWMEKQYLRAACIPSDLIEDSTKASVACEQAWRNLKQENNWRDFLPYFERSFALIKEIANRRAEALQVDPYDAMIDGYAPGFNQVSIDAIFLNLKNTLLPLIPRIIKKQQNQNIKIPVGPFPIEKQKMLGLELMKALGFDFKCGRLDVSHHPFSTGGPTDVRITTRYEENDFLKSMMGVCHETGHALYEQGLPREWIDQPVGSIHSMVMHESQSLLIEMEVCRSSAYQEFFTSLLCKQFGKQEAFTKDNLHKLVTRVEPGLIRVDADEVSYPLHIILRYEIEKLLFNGSIKINDIPSYWDNLMTQYFGISTKGNDQFGAMQDVHWPAGAFGYFPAYTLGRLMAAQLFSKFIKSNSLFYDEIKEGNFSSLNNWLNENVYSYASLLPNNDLLIKVTGKRLEMTDFISRIEQRYL